VADAKAGAGRFVHLAEDITVLSSTPASFISR
jgi:hypothetical protein